MHVVYLIDSLVPGGAERSLAALAPEYRRLGIDLDVATLHDRPGLQADLEHAGARLFTLAGRGGRLGWTRRATALVRDRRPDLVHTTLFEADLAGRLAGALARVPVVGTLANEAYGPEQRSMPGIRPSRLRAAQAADAATARLVRRFHAVSESVASAMASRLRVPRARIDVIPRGRDPEELGRRTAPRRDAARASLGLGPADAAVLAVGRQEHQKGFDVLFESAARARDECPGLRVLVAGRPGAATPALEALVHDRGLEPTVRFLGVRDDVGDLLCAADVFAFPSRWEGSPGSVIEALALEVPIVATDIDPVREVVGGSDAARLVAAGDPAALAAALLGVLGGAERPDTDAGRARFEERFTIGRVAEQMLRFYERSLGAGSGP
jgi:glycosyltransferase involved in cell wall biosynthesis